MFTNAGYSKFFVYFYVPTGLRQLGTDTWTVLRKKGKSNLVVIIFVIIF